MTESASDAPRYEYDAFVSYAWTADKVFAPFLVRAVHNFARKWYRRRSVHLFLDVNGLATEEAWVGIRQALDGSRRLILLASTGAAGSESVARELVYWRTLKRPVPIIVVTDGVVTWSDEEKDFQWQSTTAIPRALSGAFAEEPLRLDVTGSRHALSSRNPKLRQVSAVIYSILSEKKLDDVIGEDVRVYRRNILSASSAFLAVLALAVLAGFGEYRRQIDDNAATLWSNLLLDDRSVMQAQDDFKTLNLLSSTSDAVKLRFIDKLIANNGLRKIFSRDSLAVTRAIVGASSEARRLLVKRADSATNSKDPLVVLAAHLGSQNLTTNSDKLASLPKDALASMAPLLDSSTSVLVLEPILDALDESARVAEELEERRTEPEIGRLLKSICARVSAKDAASAIDDLIGRFERPQSYHNYPELADCFFSIPEVRSKRLIPKEIERLLSPPTSIEEDLAGASKYPQLVVTIAPLLNSEKAAELILKLVESQGVDSPELMFMYADAAKALSAQLSTATAARVALVLVRKESRTLYKTEMIAAIAQGLSSVVSVDRGALDKEWSQQGGKVVISKALTLLAAKRKANAASRGMRRISLSDLTSEARVNVVAAARSLSDFGEESRYVQRLVPLLERISRGEFALFASLDNVVEAGNRQQHFESVENILYFRHPDLAPWLALATESIAKHIKPEQAAIGFPLVRDSYQTYRDRSSKDGTDASLYLRMLLSLAGRTQGEDRRHCLLGLIEIAAHEYGLDLERLGRVIEEDSLAQDGGGSQALLTPLLEFIKSETKRETLIVFVRAAVAFSATLKPADQRAVFKRILSNPFVPQQAIEQMLKEAARRPLTKEEVRGWWNLQTE